YIESSTEALLFEELLCLKGFQGEKPSQPFRDYIFARGGIPYIFSARHGSVGMETFYLTLVCTDKNRSKLEYLEPALLLEGVNPFKYLTTKTEPDTVSAAKHLSLLCKESLDAGYRWLEQSCIKAIDEDKSLIIDELYRIVRSAVPLRCAETIWLYMLAKK